MELYAGIDLHSNNSVVTVLDEKDRTVYARRLPNNLDAIVSALRACAGSVRGVAVESTYNWYWLVDGLQAAGFTVHLVNTAAVKQYDGLKHGGDFSDLIHEHLRTVSNNTLTVQAVWDEIQNTQALSMPNRALLGQAARIRKAGWFKSISWMEDVARSIVAPDLPLCDPGFIRWVPSCCRRAVAVFGAPIVLSVPATSFPTRRWRIEAARVRAPSSREGFLNPGRLGSGAVTKTDGWYCYSRRP